MKKCFYILTILITIQCSFIATTDIHPSIWAGIIARATSSFRNNNIATPSFAPDVVLDIAAQEPKEKLSRKSACAVFNDFVIKVLQRLDS